MRKIVSIVITASVVLIACKKDQHNNVVISTPLQKVTFEVGFSQTTGGFQTNSLKLNSTADTSITNNIDVLYYMVFDANGKSLHNITQAKADTGFGRYTDNLHPGNYTVAIAGGKTGLSITAGDLDKQYLTYNLFVERDLFFKKISLAVTNTASMQTVNLQRVTSEVLVVVKDAIPSNVATLKVTVSHLYGGFSVGAAAGNIQAFSRTFTYNIPAAAIGTKNYTVATPIFLSNGVATINIKAVDGAGAIIAEKNVAATTGQNKVTILSGNLFGGNGTAGTGGFTISFPGWNPPVTQTF